MRKLIYCIALLGLFLASCEDKKKETPDVQTADTITVTMGAEYANDIYYSLSQGEVSKQNRTDWQLAFESEAQGCGILINDGAGVEVFTYPGKTIANFADTLYPSTVKGVKLYNSTSTWIKAGALNTYTNVQAWDFGWGIYNASNHMLSGDSIYIIKYKNSTGTFVTQKLAILKREPIGHYYYFAVADTNKAASYDTIKLSGDQNLTQRYLYYSFLSPSKILNREPDKDKWDLLFTTYMIPFSPYAVPGAKSNEGITVFLASGADTLKKYNEVTYKKGITSIGSDWYEFDHVTRSYIIKKIFFYVKVDDSNYYKIKFVSFDRSKGIIKFIKEKIEL